MKEKNKKRSFSDFIRNATLEEKQEVFKEVIKRVNEEQRAVIKAAEEIEKAKNKQN